MDLVFVCNLTCCWSLLVAAVPYASQLLSDIVRNARVRNATHNKNGFMLSCLLLYVIEILRAARVTVQSVRLRLRGNVNEREKERECLKINCITETVHSILKIVV